MPDAKVTKEILRGTRRNQQPPWPPVPAGATIVAVDGSAARHRRFGDIGGWSAVFETGEAYLGGALGASCLDTEIVAAALAIERAAIHRPLAILSDCRPVVRTMRLRLNRGGNQDAWLRLDAALAAREDQGGASVTWHWVRGHAGHELNQRADDMARAARRAVEAAAEPSADDFSDLGVAIDPQLDLPPVLLGAGSLIQRGRRQATTVEVKIDLRRARIIWGDRLDDLAARGDLIMRRALEISGCTAEAISPHTIRLRAPRRNRAQERRFLAAARAVVEETLFGEAAYCPL